MIRGRDVSHYQGNVDWAGLAASEHLDFGAAKCSEGLSFVDSYFKQNRARIKAAGLSFISYHYATPSASSARAQAAKHVALSDPQPGDALCLDLEKSSLNQSQTNAWMRSYGDALHELAPGITTIAYLGGYAANGSGQSAVDHFDHWWYPRYPGFTTWPTTFTPRLPSPNTTGFRAPRCPSIWQFTPASKGMDANVSNLTVDELFGGSMPTAAEIVDALMARQLPNPADPGSASFAAHVTWANKHATQARDAANACLAILNGTNPDGLKALAQAIVAELPDNPGGAPSADEVATATVAKFSTLLGGTA